MVPEVCKAGSDAKVFLLPVELVKQISTVVTSERLSGQPGQPATSSSSAL